MDIKAKHLTDSHQAMLRDIVAEMRGKGGLSKPMRSLRKRGVCVLFAGPGATGKALAAKQLGAELRCDVQRIDLSTVVTKYIAETEKNLGRIFDAAESGGALLFFDEADALFGRRADVKDSHDRYANAEVNYLLERMEAFNGLAILATNQAAPIDAAFTRRMQFVLNFPVPSPADRKKIWEQAFPAKAPSPPDAAAAGPQRLPPGMSVEEVLDPGNRRIIGVETGIAGFLGTARQGLVGVAQSVLSWNDFQGIYGTASAAGSCLSEAVRGFFENGGKKCIVLRVADGGTDDDFISGLAILKNVELNIFCAPGIASDRVQQALLDHCEELRDRFCILDPPKNATVSDVADKRSILSCPHGFGALYYPWILAHGKSIPPSGHVAGVYVRTDIERGVHKVPAGMEAVLSNVAGMEPLITDTDQAVLNPRGVNTIRTFNNSFVLWGGRTLSDDQEWKYVNVRRTIIYLEQSVKRGTQWAVFEPNSETTWMKIRRSVGDFLREYWQSGALAGAKPEQAFYVKCDNETTTSSDIAAGRMHCEFGVALLKPAEFIVLRMQLKSLPA